MATAPLRKCPTCGTKANEVKLGLRDYNTWLNLPGKEGPMDVDLLIEKNGRFLVAEYKPRGERLPLGQLITLRSLVLSGIFDVWVVWHDDGDLMCEVGALDRHGRVPFVTEMNVKDLAKRFEDWRNDEQTLRQKKGESQGASLSP